MSDKEDAQALASQTSAGERADSPPTEPADPPSSYGGTIMQDFRPDPSPASSESPTASVAPAQPAAPAPSALESAQVDAALVELKLQYLIAGNKYYLKDTTKTLAFEDTGKAITTALNSPEVARSMLRLAQSKGWSRVVLSGTNEFRSKAWIEAQVLGIATKGYTPDDFDLEIVRQRKATQNVDATRTASAPEAQAMPPLQQGTVSPARDSLQTPTELGSKPVGFTNDLLVAIRQAMQAQGTPADTRAVIDHLEGLQSSPRVFIGKLVDHGAAPYQFDDRAAESYYAKIETPKGEQIVWGIDLPRALGEGAGARPMTGDQIILAFEGSKPVNVLDEATGQWGVKHRNTWYAEKLSELPALAKRGAPSPSYSEFPSAGPLSRAIQPPAVGQLDARQQMVTDVLKSKGAPQSAIGKALSSMLGPRPVRPAPTPSAPAIKVRPSL